MIASEDVGLGQEDLDNVTATRGVEYLRNEKKLRSLIWRNVHEVSPWKEEILCSLKRKMFCFCSGRTQPLMKRAFDSEIPKIVDLNVKSAAKIVKIGKEIDTTFWQDNDAVHIGMRQIGLREIKKVMFHGQNLLEIFTKQRRSVLLRIPNLSGEVLAEFRMQTPMAVYTQKWLDYQITTFKYLIVLNEFSGRSFHDLSKYPVFPSVVSFASSLIEYRDFSKRLEFPNLPFFKFYLGSCGPFNSISVDSEFSGGDSELCPEFFSSPEFFSADKIPKWSSDPIEFVYTHRKILEGTEVSQTVAQWISSVFRISHPARKPIQRIPIGGHISIATDQKTLIFAQIVDVNMPLFSEF